MVNCVHRPSDAVAGWFWHS